MFSLLNVCFFMAENEKFAKNAPKKKYKKEKHLENEDYNNKEEEILIAKIRNNFQMQEK